MIVVLQFQVLSIEGNLPVQHFNFPTYVLILRLLPNWCLNSELQMNLNMVFPDCLHGPVFHGFWSPGSWAYPSCLSMYHHFVYFWVCGYLVCSSTFNLQAQCLPPFSLSFFLHCPSSCVRTLPMAWWMWVFLEHLSLICKLYEIWWCL